MASAKPKKPSTPKIDKSRLRQLAVAASCDPRTIQRVLAGESVRGMSRERAEAALRAAGFQVPAASQP
jgi:hypothetical protein